MSSSAAPTRPPPTTCFPPSPPGRPPCRLDPLATFVNSPADLQRPVTNFYSFSIQRQFHDHYLFEIGYSGARAYHQIRQGNTNPGILSRQQADTVIASRNANSIPGLQARRLNPAWGSRVTIESTAIANYNAMFLRFDKKFSRGLLLGANYTWSANFSDNDESLGVGAITNSTSQVPQDFFNFKPDYARSAFDRPHRFVVHYSYELPWFSKGAAAAPVLKYVFGGWQITGFSAWQSGQPFTIRTGVDSGGTGTTGPFRPHYNRGGTFRPDPIDGSLRTFSTPFDGTGIVLTPLAAAGIPLGNSMPGGGNLGKSVLS